jgi:hypothetical protein
MSENATSRVRRIWRQAWPAWVLAGAIGLIIAGMILGQVVPILEEYRVTALAAAGGVGCLIVFGVPLLVAWAVWSLLKIRHWAGRSAVYLVLWLGDVGFLVWWIEHAPLWQM